MTQVWHGLVDTLRLLPTVSPDPNHAGTEKVTLDDALEKISVLIALRRGEPIAPETIPVLTPGLSTPLTTGGGVKRKRRPSVSASPAPTAPLPTFSGIALEPIVTSVASPLHRSGTPGSREVLGKQRKELYLDQLPLQPGRKVAFKVPTTKVPRTGGDDDGADNDWILATIIKCSSQDKMRYEVQDADDATK